MGGREVTHAFNGMGTIVEVPNQPGDGEDVFRDDLVFPQGTLHLATTNLGFAFNVSPRAAASDLLARRPDEDLAVPSGRGVGEPGAIAANFNDAQPQDRNPRVADAAIRRGFR